MLLPVFSIISCSKIIKFKYFRNDNLIIKFSFRELKFKNKVKNKIPSFTLHCITTLKLTPYNNCAMTTLRIRHPKGVLKLEIPSGATALWLYEQIAEQLGPLYVDVKTFWLSQDPTNPDTSRLAPSAQTPLNFAHGELLYLQLKKAQTVDNMAGLGSPVGGGMKSVSVDEKLQKQSGMIKRSRDERLCRHGPVGMCEHCQPLEVKPVLLIIVIVIVNFIVNFILFYLSLTQTNFSRMTWNIWRSRA